MFGPLHFSTLAVSIYDVWGPHPWIDTEVLEPLENPSGLQVSRCAAFFDRLWAQKTVPFAIHGDGAEFHRHSEYFVMSWTSAFITGGGENCLVSRYPISLVAEAQMADDRDPWLKFMHKRTNNENPQLISGKWYFEIGVQPCKQCSGPQNWSSVVGFPCCQRSEKTLQNTRFLFPI